MDSMASFNSIQCYHSINRIKLECPIVVQSHVLPSTNKGEVIDSSFTLRFKASLQRTGITLICILVSIITGHIHDFLSIMLSARMNLVWVSSPFFEMMRHNTRCRAMR